MHIFIYILFKLEVFYSILSILFNTWDPALLANNIYLMIGFLGIIPGSENIVIYRNKQVLIYIKIVINISVILLFPTKIGIVYPKYPSVVPCNVI
jgi:hypothetical protein